MAVPEIPISKTKIILPRRRVELLSRPRLLDILTERLDRRLIIVAAPPGYGKTSLLIDLAHQSELTFCWLALDHLDRDPQRFIGYLIAALCERFPNFGGRARWALSGLTGLESGLEPLLVTLVNEIHDEIAEHFVLVLDDFHLMDEAAPIQAFINRFVRLMDENCHLILSSRTLPELTDLPLLVARDEVGGLDFADLAFRTDEIQALLTQNEATSLSNDEAQRLAQATEGWITGIQFADVGALRAGRDPFKATRVIGVNVFDYLGQQVVDQLSPDMQLFLLRTSILEEFDATLCDAVLAPLYPGQGDHLQMVEQVRHKNLFALPVGTNGQWLRYHHLFRDYLQSRFRRERPLEVEPLLRRLAQIREQQGEWESAYELHQQLGDRKALADLIERAGNPMFQSAMLTLESWINDLPPSMILQRPRLQSLRGAIATMRGRSLEAQQILDSAVAALRQDEDTEALATALIRRGHAHRFAGDYVKAMEDATEAVRMTEEADDLQGHFADALRLRGLMMFRKGQTRQAVADLERSLQIHQRRADSTVPQLLMETAMAHALLGEYRRAQEAYEKALQIWKQSGNLFNQATLLNNYGNMHHQLGEYERAAQAFEEGLLCARQCGYRRMEALISISLGDLYSEIEDFEIAAQNYRKAGEILGTIDDRYLSNYLLIAGASLALLRRDPEHARTILEQVDARIPSGKSGYELGLQQLVRGRLSLLERGVERALAEFTEAKRCFAEDGRETESIWSAVWLAAAHLQAGQTTAAMREFGEALQQPKPLSHSAVVAARQAGTWLEIAPLNREMRTMLRALMERTDRLDDQLPGIRRQLRRMARTIELPEPNLTIRAFGRGQVWVGGRLVSTTEWQTQAVRELFFYFLAMNKPVTKEQVGSLLWPETTDPARLRLRFKNEIYRLRRAVGQEIILYQDEYYQVNPAIDHEYDVEAFEAYLARARSSPSAAEQITYLRRAIDLVGGPYLEDLGAIWIVPERERLRQAHLQASIKLAELYFQEGQPAAALQTCHEIIEHDSGSEAAYRLKMQIHGRLGDKASLIRTYRDCEENLQSLFGLPPSAETQELFRKLVA
jgi:ATP/maltotriose-dependent transcriptional regulator MalT/DNA-binding SARP family transcriptional activator